LAIVGAVVLGACSSGSPSEDEDRPSPDDTGSVTQATGSPSGTTTSDGNLQRYESDEHGFSLGYPDGWTLQDLQDSPADVALAADESAADGFAENVNVLVQQVPEGLTLDQYTQTSKQGLETLQGFELGSEGSTNLGGESATWLEYEAVQQGVLLQFWQVWTVRGPKAYVVTYTGRGEGFDRFRMDVESIVRSFEFS
jgi:serine/threonine-protein kinase